MKKTMKREVGVGVIAALFALAAFTASGDDAALIEARSGVLGMLAWPSFAFLSFAFGAEWISKQTNWGGAPEDFPPPDGMAG